MTQQHIPSGTIRGGPVGQNPPNEKVRRASPQPRGVHPQVMLSAGTIVIGLLLILINFVALGVIVGAFGAAWLFTAWLLTRHGRVGKAVRNFSREAVGDEAGAASRKL
jgi:hypothetical protein